MSQKQLILVTGASGQVGSTGYHTIKNLIEHGYRVRALVRHLDGRSTKLSALGQPGDVEIFKGDMLDYNSVREAVKGVKRIYFCFPVSEGILPASVIMARAARDEGIKGLVNMSQGATVEIGFDVASKMSRDHWFSEQVFDWAGIGAIHINPYFFLENYLIFPGPPLMLQGTAFAPFDPNFKHTPIAAEDLGVVISKLLMNPEQYFGRRIPLTGPPSNTGSWKDHYEVASKITGKQIAFACVPIEAWAQAASQVLNTYAVQHLSVMAQVYNRGGMDKQHVSLLDEFIPRDQQTTVEQFFKSHAHLFDGKTGMQEIWGPNSAK